MLKLNIVQLVDTLHEAPAFSLPKMNIGTSYLFKSVYRRLSKGEEVRLSDLDFSAFAEEDINNLGKLFNDVLELNSHHAYCIIKALQRVAPVCKPTLYI